MKRRVLLLTLAGLTLMSFGAFAQNTEPEPTADAPEFLEDVVVTAHGISREKKTVGYAV